MQTFLLQIRVKRIHENSIYTMIINLRTKNEGNENQILTPLISRRTMIVHFVPATIAVTSTNSHSSHVYPTKDKIQIGNVHNLDRVRFTKNFFVDSIGNPTYSLTAALEVIGGYVHQPIAVIADFSFDKSFRKIIKKIKLSANPENKHLIKHNFSHDFPANKIYVRLRGNATQDIQKIQSKPKVIYSITRCISPMREDNAW